MTQDDSNEDSTPRFNRRDMLKAGAVAGAIGAFGSGIASAKKPKRFVVGTKRGRAGVAKRRATEVSRVIDFGSDIGEAVAGRWPEEALRNLEKNPNVRYVEEDIEARAYSHPAELQWSVDRIDAEVAHAAGDTGNSVDVAILDTGIDSDHPDLAGHLGTGHSPIDCDTSGTGSCNQDWDDDDGHGTHVAGIVGAIANTSQVVGVAPNVTLHAVKVLDENGTGPFSTIADGMNIAVNNGYDVINMSLGACCPDCGAPSPECDSCPDPPSVINDAMDNANDNNVVVVAAAGNDGNRPDCGGDGDTVCGDNDCVSTPANHPDIIAVSSTTRTDALSGFSSVGPEVDIAGPGSAIPSTFNDGGTATLSGTSMATPHVAGVAALLLGDGVAPGNVLSTLQSTADDIGLASYQQGAGLVDAAAALGHNTANDLLEVETDPASPISFTSATLRGDLTDLTGSASATVGFEWGKQGSGFPNTASAGTRTTTGNFSASTTGLDDGENYQFRAVTTNAEGSTERGQTRTFTTLALPTASFDWSPKPVVRNEPATFDASSSTDPDGNVVKYEWDWNNDGTFDDSTTSPTINHTFTTGGPHTVTLRVTDDDGGTDTISKTFTVYVRVAIDIAPNGGGPNAINPNKKGNVPVAVLHTSAFDPPAELDPSTVHFGDPDDVGFTTSDVPQGGATPAHPGGHVEDVDDDGDDDSLFHFPARDTGFESSDTQGEIVGLTKGGVPVFGTDGVKIVGGG